MTTAVSAGTGRALAILALSLVALLAWSATAQAAAPANDDFAGAHALFGTSTGHIGTNVEATKESGEPNHAGEPGGHSVWYSWTAPNNDPVGVKIHSLSCFGGGFEGLLAVYTGSSVSSLTPVASSETSFGGGGCFFSEPPMAEFKPSAGTTYWIAVDGESGSQGPYELLVEPPPANDDFTTAETIPAEPPQSVSGSNRMANKQSGEPDHAGEPGGHSVWFSWTPSASEPVRISTCSAFSNLDPVLAVYTGSAVNALTEVASNDEAANVEGFPGCSWSDSEVRIDAVAGTTYRIAVDGANGTVGRFTLRIRGRPANDSFDSPHLLPAGLPSFAATSNEFATKQSGEPDHAGEPGGHSVWFSWTPSNSGPVKLSTCSTEGPFDPVMAVYTGSELTSLSPVGANDDGAQPNCRPTDSEFSFSAVAGTTYRIAVDGRDGDEGRFNLDIDAPPANDGFATAKALPAELPGFDFGSTRSATKESGEPNHAGEAGGRSVWFTWTPSGSGPVAISVCTGMTGQISDPLLGVYTGGAVNALTPVASNDDSPSTCGDNDSAAEFDALAGTTYRIVVDGKDAGGYFTIELNGAPTNDDFANATALPVFPIAPGGSTVFASEESGEPDHAGNAGGHSVWFTWEPDQSGPVAISACGRNPEVDTLLGVYTGGAVHALTPVANNDDAARPDPANEFCEASEGRSEVTFNAVAGTVYRVAVDTKYDEGRFGMVFETAPVNDDLADAQPLPAAVPTSGFGNTKMAGRESGEPDHAGEPGGHSVWFSWTPSRTGPVELIACTHRAGFDTVIGVYTGTELTGLAPVAGGDSGQGRRGCRSSDGEAGFSAVAGTTYLIAVDGEGGSTGAVQLLLDGAARNDDFAEAQPLGGTLPAQLQLASNRFATKQVGEADHAGDPGGSSVWFKWTAPRTATVSVDTCDSSFDTLLAVYTGATLGTLTPVASNDDGGGSCAPRSKLTFTAVANTTYRIAVDGKAGVQGDLELYVEGAPKNDGFDHPEMVPGSVGWYWPGTSVLSSKETGEPDHAGDPGGHSVWYSWTPSKNRAVELEACSRSFEPLLGVYTGSAVDGLTPVAATDAGSGECDEGRSIRFSVNAGTTYRLAVDGAAGSEGHFQLHLRTVVRSLSVLMAGSGTGSVASVNRSGINCGVRCEHDFVDGTAVTLTAAPAAGSTFTGWSGGGCSGTGPCQLTLKSNATVTAIFDPVSSAGGGAASGGTVPPVAGPPPGPPPPKKPLKCKRGFKKKLVKGKPRCVKKKKKKSKRHRGRTR